MIPVEQDFKRRVETVPRLELGLSIDLYSPDLFELMARFDGQEYQPGYLEVFRAPELALQRLRQRFPTITLACHGEGLWVTQPDFATTPFFNEEMNDVARELTVLRSPWLNHECATKQMAGYSFGTYLPPLYTSESAAVVADNITLLQEKMDRTIFPEGAVGPLFLLEMPPLTYFMAGTIPIPQFFRRVTDQAPCGLVLDMGHLWTVYRYTAARHRLSLEQFIEQFLDEFPMERVVEIHVAGLDCHESAGQQGRNDVLPEWVDAHAAPIQAVSWAMLEQVLAHSKLTNLRGVALEVDTKPIENIVQEFSSATERFGSMVQRTIEHGSDKTISTPQRTARLVDRISATDRDREQLHESYVRYAKIASGYHPPEGPEWQGVLEDPTGLARYVENYLPYEILHWGGDVIGMFPETSHALLKLGLAFDGFVAWWFHTPRPIDRPYDYFLLKIDYVLAFIAERAPACLGIAEQEADGLRMAYADANNALPPVMETAR